MYRKSAVMRASTLAYRHAPHCSLLSSKHVKQVHGMWIGTHLWRSCLWNAPASWGWRWSVHPAAGLLEAWRKLTYCSLSSTKRTKHLINMPLSKKKKKRFVNPWHREIPPHTHSIIDYLQRLGLDAESLVHTRVQRVRLEHEVQKIPILHPFHMTWWQQDGGRLASWETRHFKRWQLSRDPEKNTHYITQEHVLSLNNKQTKIIFTLMFSQRKSMWRNSEGLKSQMCTFLKNTYINSSVHFL